MTHKKESPKVTDKRIIFAEQYIIHNRNATVAYRAVYGQELSDNAAAASASKLLRNPKIQEYLKVRLNVLELDSNYVLEKLKNLAESAKTDNTKLQAVIAIGRSLGMFSDNVVVDQKMTDESRQDLIKEHLRQIFKKIGPKPGYTKYIQSPEDNL